MADVCCVEKERRRVAMFPSAGMGHFTPFLHLARRLATRHGFSVTFITADKNVSATETAHVQSLASSGVDIHVVKLQKEGVAREAGKEDPFFCKWEAMRASMPAFEELLRWDLLQQSPPLSAIITDPVLSPTLSIAAKFNVPCFVLYTTSAFNLGLALHAPLADAHGFDFADDKAALHIPGFPRPLPSHRIPPALKIKDHIFRSIFLASGSELPNASAILVNTFDDLEHEYLQAHRATHAGRALPPVYAIGPLFLASHDSSDSDVDEAGMRCLAWLDAQPARSVVYVSFGSRSAMSAEQIAELALGLEMSQHRFLWVLRTSVVDGGADGALSLPAGFLERVGNCGLVVSAWVPQVKILSHVSTGAFVSHCGWNSVVEGLCSGVPIIAWPLFGDQMMNASVVVESAKAGVEVRKREEDGIVTREEVAAAVKEIVERDDLKKAATHLQQQGKMAVAEDGILMEALQLFRNSPEPKDLLPPASADHEMNKGCAPPPYKPTLII